MLKSATTDQPPSASSITLPSGAWKARAYWRTLSLGTGILVNAIRAKFTGRDAKKEFFGRFYDATTELADGFLPEVRFINVGYAEPGARADAAEVFARALYHVTATGDGMLDLRAKDVVEVGSGRGGGAAELVTRLGAARVTALDLSPSAIESCRAHFGDVPNLEFQVGDAEKMPLQSESADVVVNVESSHCYPNLDAFVKEVARVLRPGGHFMFTDALLRNRPAQLHESLERYGLELLVEDDITARVIGAADLAHEHNLALVASRRAPVILKAHLLLMLCDRDTFIVKMLRKGTAQYVRVMARKRGYPGTPY